MCKIYGDFAVLLLKFKEFLHHFQNSRRFQGVVRHSRTSGNPEYMQLRRQLFCPRLHQQCYMIRMLFTSQNLVIRVNTQLASRFTLQESVKVANNHIHVLTFRNWLMSSITFLNTQSSLLVSNQPCLVILANNCKDKQYFLF